MTCGSGVPLSGICGRLRVQDVQYTWYKNGTQVMICVGIRKIRRTFLVAMVRGQDPCKDVKLENERINDLSWSSLDELETRERRPTPPGNKLLGCHLMLYLCFNGEEVSLGQ
jgi:hypothetical protein